jgi:uncharacterized membrane protein YoaK (UPF0700 family)
MTANAGRGGATGGEPAAGGGSAGTGQGDQQDARAEFRIPLLALVVTTGVAGFLDAFSLLRYGAFVANQSGNVVHIGMGLAGWHPHWPTAAASLVGLAVGTGTMSRLRRGHGRWAPAARTLAGTIAALAIWAVLNSVLHTGMHSEVARLALTALGGYAMGNLTTLFSSMRGLAATITYQSGTVAKLGERAARSLAGPGGGRSRARWGVFIGLLGLLGYGGGGAIGAVAQVFPVWMPVWALLALLLLMTTLNRGQTSQ